MLPFSMIHKRKSEIKHIDKELLVAQQNTTTVHSPCSWSPTHIRGCIVFVLIYCNQSPLHLLLCLQVQCFIPGDDGGCPDGGGGGDGTNWGGLGI